MPAVLRPALCCVARRTLCSVFDRLRSISFCRLRTRLRSPSCDALKIRRRSRRTSSSTGRTQIASHSSLSSCGPFTTSVSNLSTSAGVVIVASRKAHLAHVSSPFRARAERGIRPVPPTRRLEESGTTGYGVLLPFGRRRWLLGPSCSRHRSSVFLPVDSPRHCPDQGGVSTFHMRKTRPGRVPPISLERRCSCDRSGALGRRLPLPSGQPLHPGTAIHLSGAHFDEMSSAVHSRSPVRPSPHLQPSDGSRTTSAFPLSFEPRRYHHRL